MGFKSQAFNEELIRPSEAHLIAFPYTLSTDKTTDRANADALLEQYFLLFDATWSGAARNGGIREGLTAQGGSGGITSVSAGGATTHGAYSSVATDLVILMAGGWEDSGTSRKVFPLVEYNGVPVPLSDYKMFGDGNSHTSSTVTERVIVIDNSSSKYSAGGTWKVSLYRPVLGLREMDLGGKPLPQTTTQEKLLGFDDPIFTRTTRDGGPGSGSFTVVENVGRMRVALGDGGAAAEVLNWPGEDLEKMLLGSNWTTGGKNELSYQPADVNICLAQVFFNPSFPNLHTATASEQGKHFASVYIHYGVRVTDWGNVQNASADSGDSIRRVVSVEWDSVYKKGFKTAA